MFGTDVSNRQNRFVVVVGDSHHGRNLASLITRWCQGWRARYFGTTVVDQLRACAALTRASALIAFGGPAPASLLSIVARGLRVPVIVLWAGCDVAEALGDPKKMSRILLRRFHHVTVAKWLADELRNVGVEAPELAVVAVPVKEPPARLPSQFTLLTYLPEPRCDSYGRAGIFEIARRFPDVTMLVAGRGGPDHGCPPNVRFMRHAAAEGLYEDATVLVRLCDHDGMATMVIEALARGRHCIWTHALPGVHAVNDTAEAIEVLGSLKREHDAGTLGMNDSGLRYVAKELNPRHVATGIVARIESIRRSERTVRAEENAGRVSVSGHPIFVQRIAERNANERIKWRLDFLETDSRFEVLRSLWLLMRSDVWYVVGLPEPHPWIDLLARLLRKVTVFHWIGSDIPFVRQRPALKRRWKRGEVTHLAEATWTLGELRDMSIEATLVPLPVRLADNAIPPFPSTFTILLYIPMSRAEFYGASMYRRLVESLANEDISFIVVGGGDFQVPASARIRNVGWTDSLAQVYAQTTALVRMTERDGLSLMVLEALSYGRYVLWPQSFDYVNTVLDYEALAREVRNLLARNRHGTLRPNAEAAEYIREHYGDAKTVSALVRHWESRLTRTKRAKRC